MAVFKYEISLQNDSNIRDYNELYNISEKTNFLGHIPCPMKQYFREGFERIFRNNNNDIGMNSKFHLQTGYIGLEEYDYVNDIQDIDDFPDVIVSMGFDNFFGDNFMNRFVKKGYFKAVTPEKINKNFDSIGIIDPEGWYTIYSLSPYVIMVDKRKLGNLPVPKTWKQLLNPQYKNNIIISESKNDLCEVLPMYIYKEYGDEGIEMLARNIKSIWHHTKIAKLAGTNSDEGSAIYVVSWMFAEVCPNNISIIWPKEGAITSPLYMLTKESKIDRLKMVTDYVTGYEYGKQSAEMFMPVINSKVDNRLPENALLKWIGWEFIGSNNMDKLREHLKFKMAEHIKKL